MKSQMITTTTAIFIRDSADYLLINMSKWLMPISIMNFSKLESDNNFLWSP